MINVPSNFIDQTNKFVPEGKIDVELMGTAGGDPSVIKLVKGFNSVALFGESFDKTPILVITDDLTLTNYSKNDKVLIARFHNKENADSNAVDATVVISWKNEKLESFTVGSKTHLDKFYRSTCWFH